MARKRMFDLEIINQDSFLDLPMEAKALYFLLGMNADDEGFVAPKKVLRLYGGTEDSLKILALKNFIIPFKTGVIVITDWNSNNWLDSRRVNPTIYQEEKHMLTYDATLKKYTLDINAKPMLSENRTEESRTEESRVDNNHQVEPLMLPIEPVKKPISSKQNYELEFEKLWELYPNKKGKAKSLTKYILARKKGTTYEQVLKGINNYVEYIRKNKVSSQYIKHGDTYFNNQCWLDEYKNEEKTKSQNDEQWDLLKGVYDGTIKVN